MLTKKKSRDLTSSFVHLGRQWQRAHSKIFHHAALSCYATWHCMSYRVQSFTALTVHALAFSNDFEAFLRQWEQYSEEWSQEGSRVVGVLEAFVIHWECDASVRWPVYHLYRLFCTHLCVEGQSFVCLPWALCFPAKLCFFQTIVYCTPAVDKPQWLFDQSSFFLLFCPSNAHYSSLYRLTQRRDLFT